ncbi:hypothetical protein HY503_01255 [Candidatus Woesebacteria bacterium]|nr:hypothetical protein [Candidatus Woesebacteria bacterium]
MNKRKRFIITSILLSLGFIGIQFLENQFRFYAIGGLTLLTILLFFWSLKEGIGRNMTLLTLVLPAFFTAGVGVFWFLLPASVFARLPIIVFYGVGIYVLSLTSNIYSVAAIRTIALLRAAHGVGFVLTLVTSFLVYDAILSLRTLLPIMGVSVVLLSFPLYLQGLWAASLQKEYSGELVGEAGVFSLIMGEIALFLHFWPVTVVVGSLFLTVAMYMLLGLGQAKIEGRLFRETVREYLLVGALVFIGMFLATRWGG